MSTTTQILFNSPALHSLKRDQLVKLCKIHSIKANGKNVELIERLKTHAKSLPKDNPLSVAIRSEQEGEPLAQDDEQCGQGEKAFNPRPSSQWELVMDSITEESEEGSSQESSLRGTLSSMKSGTTVAGEFGTGSSGSKSTLTVSSSIRALASSFGLKRHATNSSTSTHVDTASSRTSSKLLSSFPLPPPSDTADELSKHSTPYDALPPPSLIDLQTDHFTFDTTDPAVVAANLNPTLGTAPLPGHTLRPGIPAPVNARLSLGLAPRTPSKQGPTTTIRLVSFGRPPNATAPTTTLPPPGDTPNLKPFKTTFDLDLGSPTAPPISFPASLYPALPASPPMDDTERRISLEASTSMRNANASADADLRDDDDVPMPGAFDFVASTPTKNTKPAFVFGSPSPPSAPFSFTMPRASASPDAAAAMKAKLAAEVMEEMNRRVFGEGGVPPTPPRIVRPLPGSARKEGTKAGRFDKAHDQVFGRMESIADVAARKEGLKRKSSAVSVAGRGAAATAEEGPRQGKRVRVDEGGADGKAKTETEAEVKQKEKEREAIRRKLEISRARRRSSAAAGGARRPSGRVSGAGVLVKPKPAARARFGFFAGAAKLVQGVWGSKKAATPASKPGPAAASSSSSTAVKSVNNPNAKPGTMGPPPPPPPIPNAPSASANKSLRPPSMRSVASTRSTAGGRARSPLPSSFAPSTASSKSTASSARTRNSSIAGASSVGTRSSAAGSMGTRNSLRVGSLGTRGSSSSSNTNTPGSTVDSTTRKTGRPSSRLLAPTASSLAKMNGSPSPGALAAVQEKQQEPAVLDAITNTVDAAADGVPPLPTGTARGRSKLLPAPARKPRISRSRVIAKLASQRVASGSSIASTSTAGSARKSLGGGGRARSSLGAKVQRGSLAGMKNAGPGPLLDAKKRARQTEYYGRRKSRGVADSAPASAAEPEAMQVDS
ncbi:hypothetical protein B0H12DRAFT_1324740 [Mycena haematopus]|nr:hypothetical protein B0H12DRAFT_1324740 [Mycena haematopus]